MMLSSYCIFCIIVTICWLANRCHITFNVYFNVIGHTKTRIFFICLSFQINVLQFLNESFSLVLLNYSVDSFKIFNCKEQFVLREDISAFWNDNMYSHEFLVHRFASVSHTKLSYDLIRHNWYKELILLLYVCEALKLQ